MSGNSTHENRETPPTPVSHHPPGGLEKGVSPKTSMHVGGESDDRVVPVKGSNKDGQPSAESLEGRRPTKENTEQPTPPRTQRRTSESRGPLGAREVARKEKGTRVTALLHHVTVTRLEDSFYALKREATPGFDGATWREYETDLSAKLTSLHRQLHRGTYRAQPSKRTYIPKADGRQRPLGIAALEDKIVQHAVVTVLNAIYEEDFLGFSYGFRPGRGPGERNQRTDRQLEQNDGDECLNDEDASNRSGNLQCVPTLTPSLAELQHAHRDQTGKYRAALRMSRATIPHATLSRRHYSIGAVVGRCTDRANNRWGIPQGRSPPQFRL